MVTNISQLFELEGWMEDAIKYAMVISNVGLVQEMIFLSREIDTKHTPRVEVQAAVKGDTSQDETRHARPFPDNLRWAYDGFKGELRITAVTNRGELQGHRRLLGQIRSTMQLYSLSPTKMNGQQGTFTSEVLKLVSIWEQDTIDTANNDENCDYTELVYGILFNILPTAWPQNI
jgi:hypothetical protein